MSSMSSWTSSWKKNVARSAAWAGLISVALLAGCKGTSPAPPPRPTASPAVTGDASAAIERSGMLPSHAEAIRGVARERDVVILFRPVNPDGRPWLARGSSTKGIHVKAKSSDWGPHRGLVPLEQRFSKLRKGPQAKVEHFDEKARESVEKGFAVAKPLVLDGKSVVILVDASTKAERVAVRDAAGGLTDGETGESLEPPRFLPDPKPLEVLADPRTGGYLTTDYDLLVVGPRQALAGSKVVSDPERGTISEFELDLLAALNQAVVRSGYTGGEVVRHGPETRSPDSPGPDFPVTAFEPSGDVRTIEESPGEDPSRALKDYFHKMNRAGYVLEPHPTWKWKPD